MIHLRFCVSPWSISEYCRKTLTALFFATCMFQYFDFLEKLNLRTVTNEFLDGLKCNFYEENFKTALFWNIFIYKLKVTCSPRLKLYWYWGFIMYGTCSRKKRTNLLKRQTIQRLTKFLFITFFMHFLK